MIDRRKPDADDDAERQEVARWTHAWMSAAALTLERLETGWDDERVAASVGARDALALVLVDAIRNVYRGAVFVLGEQDQAVRAFDEGSPGLKPLRDRLEHFDDYLRGTGRHQAERDGRPLAPGGAVRLAIVGSSGGGEGGHTIRVAVRERRGETTYVLATRKAVDSARRLARAVIERTDLHDERHARACPHCPA